MRDAMTRILLVSLLASAAAFAQSPPSVFIDDLTWTELKEQIRSGKTVVIVPICCT